MYGISAMFIFRMKNYIFTLLFFFLSLSVQSKTKWHHGIIRVNTDISAGIMSCEKVAQTAKASGIDFIVFSDQFLVHVEYGIPFLHNSFQYSKSRKSILSFGIKKYLERIKQTNIQFPEMVLIPGADIAPHYYWTGCPFFKDFTVNQFSEQLTIFGPFSYEFYRDLPVIHNDQRDFSFYSAVKLLPLLLVILGIVTFIFRNRNGYTDQQGNVYDNPSAKTKIFFAVFLILTGLIWTIENMPFTNPSKFDQYKDYKEAPYQHVIDYIRKLEKKNNIK